MGLVHGQPAIQPVANAKVEKGKVRAKGDGNVLELFMKHIKESKIPEVTPTIVRVFITEQGYNPKSYFWFLKKLIDSKFLKKKAGAKGNKSSYVVVK